MPKPGRLLVCLVEDQLMVSTCFVRYLKRSQFHCPIEYVFADGADFMAKWPFEILPRVIVLDMQLRKVHGLELLIWMRQQGINIPVIILSGDWQLYKKVDDLSLLNVWAFLDKNTKNLQLIDALTAVMAGEHYKNHITEIADKHRVVTPPSVLESQKKDWARLTETEAKCCLLRAIYSKEQRKETAMRMGIEVATVDTHLKNARLKLGVKNHKEMVEKIKDFWRMGVLDHEACLLLAAGWTKWREF